MKKKIELEDKVHRDLSHFKLERGFTSLSEAVRALLEERK